jgi:DNA invertase Pin-like site-specific DNA recombinase
MIYLVTRRNERRVGIYVRVSTDRFGDETSTELQEADCRKLCELHDGWRVAKVYRDTNTSAYDLKTKRDEYDQLMADVAAGKLDVVLIWKLDRLARNTKEALRVAAHLEEHGTDLVSVNDPGLDTTGPMGKFVFTLMAAVAELESATISLRLQGRKAADAREGKFAGGGVLPYGWKTVEVERTRGERTYTVVVPTDEPDPDQAAVVQEVARRFLDGGESLSALAKELNERGSRSAQGKRWRVQTLRSLLTSPRIAGYRQHARRVNTNGKRDRNTLDLYTATWQPILDPDTFRRLQRRFGAEVFEVEGGLRLVRRGSGRQKVAGKRNLLSGLVWCGRCEHERMQVQRSTTGPDRYTCVGCVGVTAPVDVVEEHVTREALLVLRGRRVLGHDQPDEDAPALQAELEAVREKLRKLSVAHFVDEAIGDDEYRAAREPLVQQVTALEGRIATAKDLQLQPLPDGVKLGFEPWWEQASFAERRQVIDSAVQRVVVDQLTHAHAAPFRKPGVEVAEDRDPQTGVPRALRKEMVKARVRIDWRPEVWGEVEAADTGVASTEATP